MEDTVTTLPDRTEDELWIEYRKTRDITLREVFIKKYNPLVKYVAGKVSMRMPQIVEFDDLVGFGVYGLIDAIDKYAPDKNVKFRTYAVKHIQEAIFDEVRLMMANEVTRQVITAINDHSDKEA